MSNTLELDALRSCLEGVVPSVIATCSLDGTPNITYVSQVHYVDSQHVALSFQFFNKTRANILANPFATVQVIDPDTGAHYQMSLFYLRTETEGPLFENMRAKLAGIASHTGMSAVFKLLGADVYQVLSIALTSHTVSENPPLPNRLAALRHAAERIAMCVELDELFDTTLTSLHEFFGFAHGMVLMYDRTHDRLYTVATMGYRVSGIGAEIPLGAGVIGVAAKQRIPIRIAYWSAEYAYSCAVRDHLLQSDHAFVKETEIPFPGLTKPHSQLAVPILRRNDLCGVLYVESEQSQRFSYQDEDALQVLAIQIGSLIDGCEQSESLENKTSVELGHSHSVQGEPLLVRYYKSNQSVFLDNDYLIKGVAGAVIWKLLCTYHSTGRCEFSNRELRLDSTIGLPTIADNLEARLVLLQRRLAERCDILRIEKQGRGRYHLIVKRPLRLQEIN